MPTRVSQAIGGFAQYLHGENIRIREEEKRQRQNLASQNIADAYLGLGPDADEEDVRRLTFQMIDDAANLDVMQESLPLIQSLYSESLQSMQRRKVETREDALYDFVRLQPGTEDIPESVGGSAAFELYKDERDYAKSQEITTNVDEEETMSLVVFTGKMDEQGNPIEKFRTVTGPGYKERADIQKSVQRSGVQNIKPAPMLTDSGLPVFWRGSTLYTQVNGEAVVWQESLHGRLFRGTKTQLDYDVKYETQLKGERGTAYQNMETAAKHLSEVSGLTIKPKKVENTKLPTSDEVSFSATLIGKTDNEVEVLLNEIKEAGARERAWDLWASFKQQRGEYMQADREYEEVSRERGFQVAMEEFGVTRDELIFIGDNYSGVTDTPLYNIRDEQGFLTEDAKGRRFLMGKISGKPVKTEREKIRLTNTSDQRMLEMWNALTTREKAEYIKEWKDLPDSE